VNAGRLVLLDGIAPLTEAAADAPARLQRSVAAVVAAKERNIRVYDDREQLLQARLRASAMTRESAELLLRRSTREEAGKIRLLSDPRLRDPSATYLHERQVLALVAAINTPALLILARSGEVIRRPQTTARIRAFTDLQVVEMEGHHHLHMDNAEAVARTVRPFLAA
jgi:pimeloyl-ACP methyl ester carboxylesterase